MVVKQLKVALQRLHRIPRFNSHIMTKPKSVLEHCARTALLYSFLGGKEILPALLHDYSEAVLGFDPPSPIKQKIPEIKAFELLPENHFAFENPQEAKLCKLCDGLELLLDLKEQQQLGNQTPELLDIYDEVLQEVMERSSELGRKTEIKKLIGELVK